MTKKSLILLLVLLLLPAASLADPLHLSEDLSETVTVPYDEQDPAAGSYVYSFRYPHADPADPRAYLINEFYEYLASDTKANTIPNLADYYAGIRTPASVTIDYEVTCSNDDYFSVRIHKTENADGEMFETWEGNTFSLQNGMPGTSCTLSHILGLVEIGETDNWIGDRQDSKVREAVYTLIWDRIQKNAEGVAYHKDLVREDVDSLLIAEQDFWLDASGNPVFFILPGWAADESEGLLTFSVSLEEIDDEI